MLTMEHEAPVELFREHPEVVPALLSRILGIDVPYFTKVRVTDPGTRTLVPTGQRSDAAVVLWDQEKPVVAVICEPQGRVDEDKLFAWPKYMGDLHAEMHCDTYLVVLALTRGVARWAQRTIPTWQPGRGFAPYVIGPDEVVRLTTEEGQRQAHAEPWLGALSAMLHAADEEGPEEALVALQVAREEAGDSEAFWLYQLLRAIMTPERYRILEEFIMLSPESYLPKTDFERLQFGKGKAEGEAKGKAEGKAEVLLKLLTARLGSLEPAVAERILNQRDLPRLDAWINDAVLALDTEAAMTVLRRILST